MTKAGSILIFIVFIIESIFIIPLIWTIPGFICFSRVNKNEAKKNDKLVLAILGIVFGAILGVIGGILILVETYGNSNSNNKVAINPTNN